MDLHQHTQQLLETEKYAIQGQRTSTNFRKTNRFALVYPSTYQLGMSSLGMQVIHATLNERDDTSCERVFIPEPQYVQELIKKKIPLFSLETQTPLNSFDIVGFSVSFESDYVNIVRALKLGNIPQLTEERTEWDPLMIAVVSTYHIILNHWLISLMSSLLVKQN